MFLNPAESTQRIVADGGYGYKDTDSESGPFICEAHQKGQ